MSLWKRLLDLAGHAFHHANADYGAEHHPVDPCAPDPHDTEFAAAVVALAAKMARADGKSTLDEAAAFRAAFPIAPDERPMFDRLFKLAQETVHGYEGYARRIGKRYRTKPCLLEDVLDVLFAVAAADGAITSGELSYLEKVADFFGFTETEFARISAPYFPDRAPDPYTILSVSIQASDEDIRKAWMRCVSENHPDRFIARGAPVEFIKAAHEKTAAINAAYEEIKASRADKARHNRQQGEATPAAAH
ncbi:Co-chaperone protein DjlA [Candidatus Phycosocius bacilliformis]|uniref:Co-chaperone protein DjlA n=1 Tax=Candidatus Phycosocius bacilliformis TaxID=1445552 RepID=A0A2P2E7V4_9PROT|nr:DnaJ family molecular chaperone [Candidatus Phycosocius bacilliformis]GBF57149.1 Co-chaperone protein DjlA [Candidatus Phycosocius bacilliformis]